MVNLSITQLLCGVIFSTTFGRIDSDDLEEKFGSFSGGDEAKPISDSMHHTRPNLIVFLPGVQLYKSMGITENENLVIS